MRPYISSQSSIAPILLRASSAKIAVTDIISSTTVWTEIDVVEIVNKDSL